VQELGFPLVQQPAYAPELNPLERLIEELRRAVEGRVYSSLEAKVTAIESELRKWDVDADRVRRLADWDWIRNTLNQLPNPNPIAA
jgi:transposase